MADYIRCRFCRARTFNAARGFDRCYWCGLIRRNGLVETLIAFLEQGRAEGQPRSGGSLLQGYQRMLHAGHIALPDPTDMTDALAVLDDEVSLQLSSGDYNESALVVPGDGGSFFAVSETVEGLLYRVDLEAYADGSAMYNCECPAGSRQQHCKHVDWAWAHVAEEAAAALSDVSPSEPQSRAEQTVPVAPTRLPPPRPLPPSLWQRFVKFFWG